MKSVDVIRAWKDEAYRLSLTEEQRAALPENPAGMIELNDIDLAAVAGGMDPDLVTWQSSCAGTCGWSCTTSSCSTTCSGCDIFKSKADCVELPGKPIYRGY